MPKRKEHHHKEKKRKKRHSSRAGTGGHLITGMKLGGSGRVRL